MNQSNPKPNFKIETLPKFNKKFSKLIKKNPSIKEKFIKFITILATDPQYPSLKSHQVNSPSFGKVWSSWLHEDLRVLWQYENDKIIILLLDIGSHDEVY